MAIEARYRMSAEKLEELKAQLVDYETNKMAEVAEQIKEARSYGDLSENSEYDEAKDRQGKIASKILELKDLIENAVIIDATDEENVPKDVVTLGSVVEVEDIEFKEKMTYTIVGSQEANPNDGKISDDSPLGKALRSHKAGEKVIVEAPAGNIKFKILSVVNK